MKKDGRNYLRIIWTILFWGFMLLFFGLVLGTTFHEIVGHGVTALAFGDKINAIKILFLKIDSNGLTFVPFSGFGTIWYENATNPTILSQGIITLMGSFIPLIISIISSLLLLFKRLTGFKKALFISLSLYFLDPLSNYVLPLFGYRGGSDFNSITQSTGFNIFPFILTSVISSLVIGSIIIHKISGKKKPEYEKALFYGVLISIAILLASFVYLGFQANAFDKGGINTCNKITDTIRKEGCIYSFAVSTYNQDFCNAITSNLVRDHCFSDLAFYSDNPSLCNKVIKDSIKEECFLEMATRTT